MPKCKKSLVQEEVFNATLAHIIAASDHGPRNDVNVSDEVKRHFDNLMFMCPDHGSLIDKAKLKQKYTVEWLRQAKKEHEEKHRSQQYDVPGEILADALEEIYVRLEQTNTINGDGNTQTNTQIYIAGDNLTDTAARLVKAATGDTHEDGGEDETEDDESNEPKPRGPSSPSVSPSGPSAAGRDISLSSPGTIDSIAALETAIPNWTQIMNDLTSEMNIIHKLADSYAAILQAQNKRGQPASAKLPIFKRFAKELDAPARRIEDLGLQYIQQINEINPGVYAIVELSTSNAQGKPEDIQAAYTLFNSVNEMAAASEGALANLDDLITNLRPIESMSRDLRAPLRRIRDGLAFMLESRSIVQDWAELVQKSRDLITNLRPV